MTAFPDYLEEVLNGISHYCAQLRDLASRLRMISMHSHVTSKLSYAHVYHQKELLTEVVAWLC